MIGPTSWMLLTLTVQVTVLAIAIYAIQKLALSNHPKAAARLIAFGMILMLVVSAAVTLPLPSWLDLLSSNVSKTEQQVEASEIAATQSLVSIDPSEINDEMAIDSPGSAVGPIAWGEIVKNLAGEFSNDGAANESYRSKSMTWNGVVCFGICFLSLCVFGFGRLLLGILSLRRLRLNSQRAECESTLAMSKKLCEKIGCEHEIEILLSPLVGTAATIGLWNPKVFLADDFESWGTSEQESVLAHEIAHIHHGDFAANIVSQFCTSMHFFNPAVHWLVGQMRLNQEVAADQIASQITSGTDEYTRTLATLALRQDNQNQLRLASMFIPNQNSFIRRIRMLQRTNRNGSSAASWATLLVTLVTAFVISGIRAPASTAVIAPGEFQTLQEKTTAFNTDYIGDRPDQIVSFIRPSKLNKSAIVRGLTTNSLFDKGINQLDKVFEEFTGIGTEHIEQAASVSSMNKDEAVDRTYMIVRTFEDNLENFKNLGKMEDADSSFPIQIEHASNSSVMRHGLILDERTIIWCLTEKGVENARETGRNSAQRAGWYPEFKKMDKRSVVVAGDSKLIFENGLSGLTQIFSPSQLELFSKSKSFVLAADVNKSVAITLRLKYLSGADAKSAEGSVDDIKKSLGKLLWGAAKGPEPTKSLAQSALNSIKALEAKTSDTTLELTTNFEIDLKAIKSVSGDLQKAAAQTQGMNNQRQLVLALHNYESAYGHFPEAVIRHESGEVHSWRVAILPFINEADLYKKYRFDEPSPQ